MNLQISLRRRLYRTAYALLRVYWFLLRPTHQGVKCVLTDGDRVLLVRHTYGPPEWELPGGSSKRGERPSATAAREMREELGVTVARWEPLGQVHGRMQGRRDILHCFGSELPTAPLKLDPGEIDTARWFSRSRLPPDLGRYTELILKRAAPETGSD